MRTQLFALVQAAATVTATTNGAATNVSGFTGNGYAVLNSSAATGGTSDVKLQHSDDGSTNWTDTGFAFSTVTTASFQTAYIAFDQFKKFVRAVNTLGGASAVTYGVHLVGTKR